MWICSFFTRHPGDVKICSDETGRNIVICQYKHKTKQTMDNEDKALVLIGIMITLVFAIIVSIVINSCIEYPEWFITVLLIVLEGYLAYQVVEL